MVEHLNWDLVAYSSGPYSSGQLGYGMVSLILPALILPVKIYDLGWVPPAPPRLLIFRSGYLHIPC